MSKAITIERVTRHLGLGSPLAGGCIMEQRAGCFDVGLHCGGWGQIVLKLRVEERLET